MDTNPTVVNAPVTKEEEVVTSPEGTNNTPAPGSQTESALLLKSLQEEREKRRILEEQLASQSSTSSEDVFSDEGKVLKGQINTLVGEIESLKSDAAKRDLQASNPALKEKWTEFEQFRSDPENKGMNMRTAAKAFLIEQGLTEVPRVGLERATGGTRQPTSQGMSAEDIKNLRENNFRKYQDMLMKGQIKVQVGRNG